MLQTQEIAKSARTKRTNTLPCMEAVESRMHLSAAVSSVSFYETFSGTSTANFHRPVYDPGGSTWLGRTQFVCQPTAKPKQSGGNVHMYINTFNRTALPGKPSLFGDELISNKVVEVNANKGTIVRFRARFTTPLVGGYVGGLFLYPQTPVAGHNNEVDFELVSNKTRHVNTNVYVDQPLSDPGATKFIALPNGGKVTSFHTYEIKLMPGSLSWSIDGHVVRSRTTNLPKGKFQIYMNMWGSDKTTWPITYNSALKLASSSSTNRRYGMDVDYVKVFSVIPATPPPSVTSASVVTTATSPFQYGYVLGNGTIHGVGSSTVNYNWMIRNPDGTSSQLSGLLSTNMLDGTARIPDYQLPTDSLGTYDAWVRITSPGSGLNSSTLSYTTQYVTPEVQITYVTPLNVNGVLKGQVVGVNPSDYAGVAIYLNVGSTTYPAWWTKPFFSDPITTVSASGYFGAWLTTGGYDVNGGIEVRAYLIPKDFGNVPLCGGVRNLPDSLNGLLYADVMRV